MKKFLSLALVAVALTVAACDNTDAGDEPPALFLDGAFELETNLFNPQMTPKGQAGIHFGAAAFRVWPVSLVISAHLFMPALVTHAATQVDPVFEDGAWHWTSSTTNGTQSVALDLSATPTTPGHDWSMKVSYADGQTQITDFELYSAHTENNGTEGSWQLYYPDGEASVNVLNAEFNKDSETDKELTLSVPAGAASNAGDSVTYTEDGSIRGFRWVQVGAGVETYVEWDYVTHAGSITATNYNGGEKACWDSDLEDFEC